MTKAIDSLASVARNYDAIVFDQWGVLHNGETAYPKAVDCLTGLQARGVRMAVLSNSGKRAEPNAQRIASMGFEASVFSHVVSSGEALWNDIARGRVAARSFFAIERAAGDAVVWADGLNIELQSNPGTCDAVLLMGLPDGDTLDHWRPVLHECLGLGLPLYCTNPDKASPRGDGYVISPGVLAEAYAQMGGEIVLYGKPHRPIFDAVENQLGTKRLLMVGDSLEHDIAGAHAAGWDSVLIQGGLYAQEFGSGDHDATLARLVAEKSAPKPTFRMDLLA